MSAMPPPPLPANLPDTAAVKGPGSGSTGDRIKSLLNRLTGGGMTEVQRQLDVSQQQRLASAQLHQKNYNDLSQALTLDANKEFHNADGSLTDKGQMLEHQRQEAFSNWQKAAGVNKEAKSIIGKMGEVADHIVHHRAAEASPTGMPPPPTAAAGSAGSSGPASASSGSAMPAPPGGSTTGQPAATASAPAAPVAIAPLNPQALLGQQMATIQTRHEIEKAKGLDTAKAEVEAGQPKRFKEGLIAAGFSEDDANRLTMTKFGGVAFRPKMHPVSYSDPDDPTRRKFGLQDQNPNSANFGRIYGEDGSEVENAGQIQSRLLSRTTDTTNPETGQTTHSVSAPVLPGAKGAAVTGTSKTATAAAPSSAAAGTPAPTSAPRRGTTPLGKNRMPPPIDSEGHLTSQPGISPQVLEGANQLLDGTDKDKLPVKTRELSAALARKAGWEQGKFTPKEQVMLRESTTFLSQALTDPSLSALDAGFMDRMQLAQVNVTPDKEGFIGRGMSTLAAQNMDPKQAAFIRMYNQLVGTISGLGQLVRSGRATEATIERLKAELPNPVTTKDSADARSRIQRLLKEIDVAMEKGSFEGVGKDTGTAGGSNKSSMPAPGVSSAPSSIDDEIMKAVKNAKRQ